MTRQKSFKLRVRECMSRTGEARRRGAQPGLPEPRSHRRRRSEAGQHANRPCDDKIEAATGRRWGACFSLLDEWARGMGLKHQQSDRFTIYASKTIAVPLDVLFNAFVDPGTRRRWLTDGTKSLRTSQPGRTARFDWGDGSTRVSVSFKSKAAAKETVAVAHERIPDPGEAETAKRAW